MRLVSPARRHARHGARKIHKLRVDPPRSAARGKRAAGRPRTGTQREPDTGASVGLKRLEHLLVEAVQQGLGEP